MRKLLLENVSCVSEGSQVTLTWLTAQELDKIIRKKRNLLSHLFILNIKMLWKVQTRLGILLSSSSVGILICPAVNSCPGEQGRLSWQDQG